MERFIFLLCAFWALSYLTLSQLVFIISIIANQITGFGFQKKNAMKGLDQTIGFQAFF